MPSQLGKWLCWSNSSIIKWKTSFNQQTYEHKELILVEDFNEEIKRKFDFVTFFDPNSTYREYYLEDMINGFKYT